MRAIYAAWSAAWAAETTDYVIAIYNHYLLRGQRCPYTFQLVEAFSRYHSVNSADVAIYTTDALEEAFYALISDHARSIEDRYETFFFEDQDHPDREQIHDDMGIITSMAISAGSVQEWIDTGK